MKAFAALFTALDGTTKTTAKLDALTDYFRTAPEGDRLWDHRPAVRPPPAPDCNLN